MPEFRKPTDPEQARWLSAANRKKPEEVKRYGQNQDVLENDVPKWASQITLIISNGSNACLVLKKDELGGYETETIVTKLRASILGDYDRKLTITTQKYNGDEEVSRYEYYDRVVLILGYAPEN